MLHALVSEGDKWKHHKPNVVKSSMKKFGSHSAPLNHGFEVSLIPVPSFANGSK